LCYGGDYNPDQWPETVWREDVALMRDAGVNLVSLGVFSWGRLEPEPGRLTFDWLDRVLDLLHAGGIGVNLATPTASPPPWFSLAYPDALPVTPEGVRLAHGSRDTYCVAAPGYRAAAVRIAGALAARYADHPALAMWHVHNEYGTWCHCGHVAAAFRRWLGRRYDLAGLNEAWGTAFWSQHYSAWEQVLPPRATGYLHNPHQTLDFRRFLSDELLAAFREQRDVLRAANPDIPVTTNFVFASWVPVDHRRWASEVDLVALDAYPSGAGASAGTAAEEQTAFLADLARSWAGGPWLLMEQSPGTVGDAGVPVAKAPGRMARLSVAHVARGSRGAMFFQWRASAAGAEQFHSALVPHAGPDTRIFAEARELGALLGRLSEVDAGAVVADAAIAWDAPSWWALGARHLPSPELDYLGALHRAHRHLWRAGLTADFVSLADLDPAALPSGRTPYRLVLVPSHHLVDDRAAEAVRRFVAAGGHLVVWYFSGVADGHGRVRLGGYPGAFREVLGIRVEEFHPQPPGATVPLAGTAGTAGTAGAEEPDSGTGRVWAEHVHLVGAEAVRSYAGGALAGSPAVTRHRYGAGTAWYVSTELDDGTYARLLVEAARAAGVAPPVPGLPPGVEVVRRRAGETGWLFLLNHTAEPVEVPAPGTVELVSGRGVHGIVAVPPGGMAVVRTSGLS
jgi:beta-galactosidase